MSFVVYFGFYWNKHLLNLCLDFVLFATDLYMNEICRGKKNNSRTTSSWATFQDRWFSPHFPNLHYFGMIASKIGKHEIYTHPQFRRMNVIWCFPPQRTKFYDVDNGENMLTLMKSLDGCIVQCLKFETRVEFEMNHFPIL